MSKSNSQKFVSLDGKADRNYFSTNETLVNSSLKAVLRVQSYFRIQTWASGYFPWNIVNGTINAVSNFETVLMILEIFADGRGFNPKPLQF